MRTLAEQSLGVSDVAEKPPAAAAVDFIQVAFSGHNRPEDLGDPHMVSAGLRKAFAMLADAGVTRARLVTGLAPGADRLAAKAWRDAGLGLIHAVFPFLDDEAGDGTALVESSTWLDGAATERTGRNAHLAQIRWLIGAADLLVVVWTGEHARGAGGTADAVRLALEHGVPVLWISAAEACELRLIQPEHLDEDFGFLEFLDELRSGREPLVCKATAETLRQTLGDLGLTDEGAGAQALRGAVGVPKGTLRLWRAYALFRRLLGGRVAASRARPAPDDLAAQAGFARLSRAQSQADESASRLGAIHRSQQVLLLAVAIVAAVAGSISALLPQLKLAALTVELLLALGAFAVWQDSERGHRHERWGEARRLAEDLRAERVAWTLGVSTVPHGLNAYGPRLARDVRRQAGLPLGVFGPERVRAWGEWAIDELIAGQAAYHRGQAVSNGRIAHRVHQLENLSFAVLLVVLLSYVLLSVGLAPMGLAMPHWLGGVVVMTGAIVPAIAAVGLALEATLSLAEQGQRSRLLAARLEAIAVELGPARSLESLQAAAKAAIRLNRAQEDHWSQGSARRRLFRGG